MRQSTVRMERMQVAEGSGPNRIVVLVHQVEIQHYRVAIYNYLSEYLNARGWSLVVVSGGVEAGCPHSVQFDLRTFPLRTVRLVSLLRDIRPHATILFVNLRERYLVPLILWLKLAGIPIVYWGHAIDLENKGAKLKRAVYALEHAIVDAIVLYGEQLKQFVSPRHHGKVFIANNTLNTKLLERRMPDRHEVLSRYGVKTTKNVICVGRLQRRKGIVQLMQAFSTLTDPNVGLLLVGPDVDGLMQAPRDPRVVWTGPQYGSAVQELLECADVYCMPGHVGLSIVDAFFFGLPLVTTDVDHAPEIMYLRDGVNGYLLPRDDLDALATTLDKLLHDDTLLLRLSAGAESTAHNEASIDGMCRGFLDALEYVAGRDSAADTVGAVGRREK